MNDSVQSSYYLPDLCDMRAVFLLVVTAELLAICLALMGVGRQGDFWTDLALASLFIQLVVSSCAVILCPLRRWVASLSLLLVTLIYYAVILGVALVVSGMTVWAFWQLGLMSSHWHGGEFVLRNLLITLILASLLLRYFFIQHQWQQKVQLEAQARLQALQARIRPHFLFNSMNSIASLTRSQPELAEVVVEDLAELFRATLQNADGMVSFADELQLCQRYVAIEQVRLGERLHVSWNVSQIPEQIKVPNLSLQLLLENAIYHGIQALPEGGRVKVQGGCDKGRLWLKVINPIPERDDYQGLGMGQANLAERLKMYYGGKARLYLRSSAHHYTAIIRIPLHQDDYESIDR